MYLSRRDLEEISVHRRGGIGANATMLHHEDSIKAIVSCHNSQILLFFSSGGYVFRKKASEMNDLGRKGINIREFISLPEEDSIVTLLALWPEDLDSLELSLLFATEKGLIKRVLISNFRKINVNGKVAIVLGEGDSLVSVNGVKENSYVCLASSGGKGVRFFCGRDKWGRSRFSESSRTAKGSYGIHVGNNGKLVSATTTLEGSLLLSISERGIGKLSRLEDIKELSMGKKVGIKVQKTNEKTGGLFGCYLVKERDEIILVSSANKMTRFKVSEVSVQGMDTSGVILMRLEEGERIIAFTRN